MSGCIKRREARLRRSSKASSPRGPEDGHHLWCMSDESCSLSISHSGEKMRSPGPPTSQPNECIGSASSRGPPFLPQMALRGEKTRKYVSCSSGGRKKETTTHPLAETSRCCAARSSSGRSSECKERGSEPRYDLYSSESEGISSILVVVGCERLLDAFQAS